MSRHRPTLGAWAFLACSALLAGAGLALPRVRPVPTGIDPELVSLRAERDGLAANDDATLARLREQAKADPAPAWSVEQFAALVGAGWRIEWQQPAGATRAVSLTRSSPRWEDWPDYLRFLKTWTAQPGVTLESLDLTAEGAGQGRRFTCVVFGLRIKLTAGPNRDGERAFQSRGPLPVAPAAGPAAPRKIGPVPPLRRPSAVPEPPAPGPASASFRPDPPGSPAGMFDNQTPTNPQENPP